MKLTHVKVSRGAQKLPSTQKIKYHIESSIHLCVRATHVPIPNIKSNSTHIKMFNNT